MRAMLSVRSPGADVRRAPPLRSSGTWCALKPFAREKPKCRPIQTGRAQFSRGKASIATTWVADQEAPSGFLAPPGSCLGSRRHRLQSAVRARLIDRCRQVLRKHLQRLVHRKAELPSDLLHLLVPKRRSELVRSYRQVRSVAKPRAHLVVETSGLKLGDDTLKISEIGLRQQGRDQSWGGGRLHLPQQSF